MRNGFRNHLNNPEIKSSQNLCCSFFYFSFFILSALGFSLLADTASAQDQAASPPKSAAIQKFNPGDLNLEFSRVYIFVDKTNNLGHSHGVEGKLKGGKLLTDATETSTLVFDMRSFVADTETARKVFGIDASIDAATVKKVNQNMLGNEILDVQRFPEASLEKATLTKTDRQSSRGLPEYKLEGDFTLHGKTRHVVIPCDLEIKDGWHHIRGKFTIRQTDFGIKPYTKAFGAVGIKDELVIQGDLWVVPKQ